MDGDIWDDQKLCSCIYDHKNEFCLQCNQRMNSFVINVRGLTNDSQILEIFSQKR